MLTSRDCKEVSHKIIPSNKLTDEKIVQCIQQLLSEGDAKKVGEYLSTLSPPLSNDVVLANYEIQPDGRHIVLNLMQLGVNFASASEPTILSQLIRLCPQPFFNEYMVISNINGLSLVHHLALLSRVGHFSIVLSMLKNIGQSDLSKMLELQTLHEKATLLLIMVENACNVVLKFIFQNVDVKSINAAAKLSDHVGRNVFHVLIERNRSKEIVDLLLSKLDEDLRNALFLQKDKQEMLPLDYALMPNQNPTWLVKTARDSSHGGIIYLIAHVKSNVVYQALQASKTEFAKALVSIGATNSALLNFIFRKYMDEGRAKINNEFLAIDWMRFLQTFPMDHANTRYLLVSVPGLYCAPQSKIKFSGSNTLNKKFNHRNNTTIMASVNKAHKENVEELTFLKGIRSNLEMISVLDVKYLITGYLATQEIMNKGFIEDVKVSENKPEVAVKRNTKTEFQKIISLLHGFIRDNRLDQPHQDDKATVAEARNTFTR